jgi:hypothetical protein
MGSSTLSLWLTENLLKCITTVQPISVTESRKYTISRQRRKVRFLFQHSIVLHPHLIYSFGMNYFIAGWISNQGPLEVFCIIGGIHAFICLLTIPMYVFGKKCVV